MREVLGAGGGALVEVGLLKPHAVVLELRGAADPSDEIPAEPENRAEEVTVEASVCDDDGSTARGQHDAELLEEVELNAGVAE